MKRNATCSTNQRHALCPGERNIVKNVYNALRSQFSDKIMDETVRDYSDMTKVSVRTIYIILKAKEQEVNPIKERGRKKDVLDDDVKNVTGTYSKPGNYNRRNKIREERGYTFHVKVPVMTTLKTDNTGNEKVICISLTRCATQSTAPCPLRKPNCDVGGVLLLSNHHSSLAFKILSNVFKRQDIRETSLQELGSLALGIGMMKAAFMVSQFSPRIRIRL
ncbi:unnamed protein product [Acanthoscelides obtectus]|uniref:Uncharacterized protein n=1 Tax=Acanthoscelides obtectus TaxID=200917 RepID=A0A9P0JQV5_ACAOB|nr:unnamed protein product [Acanthoscelides obtectus]CAK1671187.1 hypothetical protein AOBTE_LOCUS28124 [Acanthoscelides obtectus]